MPKKQKMPLDGLVDLIYKMSTDYHVVSNSDYMPAKFVYKIASSKESSSVERSARKAAFTSIARPSIVKRAFDSRRTDQDAERNPRHNLQYYTRSQQFIDEEDQKRLESFARLVKPLNAIKDKFGTHPEYFHSHARKLSESVTSLLKVKESDMDIFRPQMDYLEQLLYARYRISKEDLQKMGSGMLQERILSKDEDLLKRGSFMHITGTEEEQPKTVASISKDGRNGLTQESVINAIFGNNNIRRDGEKKVTRTITITISDEAE
jgi:hypothetical protein